MKSQVHHTLRRGRHCGNALELVRLDCPLTEQSRHPLPAASRDPCAPVCPSRGGEGSQGPAPPEPPAPREARGRTSLFTGQSLWPRAGARTAACTRRAGGQDPGGQPTGTRGCGEQCDRSAHACGPGGSRRLACHSSTPGLVHTPSLMDGFGPHRFLLSNGDDC